MSGCFIKTEKFETTSAMPYNVPQQESTEEGRATVIKENPEAIHEDSAVEKPAQVASGPLALRNKSDVLQNSEYLMLESPHERRCCCGRNTSFKNQRFSFRAVRTRISPYISRINLKIPEYLQEEKYNYRKITSSAWQSTCSVGSWEDIGAVQDMIGRSLKRHGICVLNRFMGNNASSKIADEVASLQDERVWAKGQAIGPNASVKCPRQDMITWLDGSEVQFPFVRKLFAKLDKVITSGKGVTDEYSICGSTKGMVSKYAGNGAHYRLHVDNPSKDGRCLTCTYYLNKDWDSSTMGGNLRLLAKTSGKAARVAPIIDRMVFFYSDARNPHEVLPAFHDRFAITLWYFDYAERSKAIGRFNESSPK